MKLVRDVEKTPQVFKKSQLCIMFFLYLFNLIGEKKLTRASPGGSSEERGGIEGWAFLNQTIHGFMVD